MRIYRELRAQGYQGSYENIRARFVDASPRTRTKLVASTPRPPVFPSKRRAVWLFLRRPEELTIEEQEIVLRLRDLYTDIDLAYLFVQQFAQMVRMRTGEKLDAWLLAVASSPLINFQPFVKSISEDKEAVFEGLTREESNGPTEGHITRLKLIKRSMYGRANFDLLRMRVLSHSHKKLKIQKTRNENKQQKKRTQGLRDGDTNAPNSQHTTTRISEVA